MMMWHINRLALIVIILFYFLTLISCSTGEECRIAGEFCEFLPDEPDPCCGKCMQVEEHGYSCAIINCETDLDCLSDYKDGIERCCFEVERSPYEFSFCYRIEPGYTCGDRSGKCGDSCTGEDFSACSSGYRCLYAGDTPGSSAICSNECETDSDCSECKTPVGRTCEMKCIDYGPGGKYCDCE